MNQNTEIHAEEWRPVVGYEGLYEVSNLGRCRRIWRYGRAWDGLMKAHPHVNGYLFYMLCRGNKAKTHRVHRVVARAFLGEPPDGSEVNHKDSDRANCRLSNLEYVTRSENVKHSFQHGRLRPPAGQWNRKFSPEVLLRVLEDKGKMTAKQASAKHGVGMSHVYRVWHGEASIYPVNGQIWTPKQTA